MCIVAFGMVSACAQNVKKRKVTRTPRVINKKLTQSVDTLNIFTFLQERGVTETGVQLRQAGNDYLLTSVSAEIMREDFDTVKREAKAKTEKALSEGYLMQELMIGVPIKSNMISGIEVKVPKSVADHVVELAEAGKLQDMKSNYVTKEDAYTTGGSSWTLEMQLPGKEKVLSGGRNHNGPSAVFDIFYYLFELEVDYKQK